MPGYRQVRLVNSFAECEYLVLNRQPRAINDLHWPANCGNDDLKLQAADNMQGEIIDDTAFGGVGVDVGQRGVAPEMVAVATANAMASACKADHGFDRIASKAFAGQDNPQGARVIQNPYLLDRVVPIAQALKDRFKTAVCTENLI